MKAVGIIYAIGAAVAWGLVYALDQKILTKVSSLVLLLVYSSVSSLLLIPFVMREGGALRSLASAGKPILVLIGLTIILVTIANFLILSSIQRIGSPLASIFEIAYPFFVVLFAAMMFGSSVNTSFWLGAILMFAGAAIILKWS